MSATSLLAGRHRGMAVCERTRSYEALVVALRDEAPAVLSPRAIEEIRDAGALLVLADDPADPQITEALTRVAWYLAARAASRCDVRSRIRRLLEACAPNHLAYAA